MGTILSKLVIYGTLGAFGFFAWKLLSGIIPKTTPTDGTGGTGDGTGDDKEKICKDLHTAYVNANTLTKIIILQQARTLECEWSKAP